MSKKKKELPFSEFLQFFPEVDLPITLSDDSTLEFSRRNKPFTDDALNDFIFTWDTEVDELTEFIPCCQIRASDAFHTIVYWKAGLNKYEYYLVTINKSGELINRKVISSTIIEESTIKKSLAHITEDLIIHIMAGAKNEQQLDYDPDMSKAFSMEILDDGNVIFEI